MTIKNNVWALAGMAQWTECWPAKQIKTMCDAEVYPFALTGIISTPGKDWTGSED